MKVKTKVPFFWNFKKKKKRKKEKGIVSVKAKLIILEKLHGGDP